MFKRQGHARNDCSTQIYFEKIRCKLERRKEITETAMGFHLLEESEFVGGKTFKSSPPFPLDKKSRKAKLQHGFCQPRLLYNNEPQYPGGLALGNCWEFLNTSILRNTDFL